MTLAEFETALRQCTPRVTWHPNPQPDANALRGHVLRESPQTPLYCCPITAVVYATTGKLFALSRTFVAARQLRLSRETWAVIVRAADGDLTPDAVAVRTRLRACVGLPREDTHDV